MEQDNILLHCQVSRSDATAQWYKDGLELKSTSNVLIEVENDIRRLIILSAHLSDSGTYTCRAGDSALVFKVNVRGEYRHAHNTTNLIKLHLQGLIYFALQNLQL